MHFHSFLEEKKSLLYYSIFYLFIYYIYIDIFFTMRYFTYFILDLNLKYMSFILKFHI